MSKDKKPEPDIREFRWALRQMASSDEIADGSARLMAVWIAKMVLKGVLVGVLIGIILGVVIATILYYYV